MSNFKGIEKTKFGVESLFILENVKKFMKEVSK